MPSGYPRHQSAPPTLPHIERQKAVLDAEAPRRPLDADPQGRRVYRLRPRGSGPSDTLAPRLAEMLDPEQRAAVMGASGRSLFLASAGSGKTRTIVATLAHAVERGAAPESIMLVTFTRRAAHEMVRRAAALVGTPLDRLLAGTFHAICHQLLRSEGGLVGLPATYSILDSEDQADLVAAARDEVLADRASRPSLPKPSAMAGFFGLAAEGGRELADVVVEQNGRLVDRVEEIVAIGHAYAERKRRMGAVDYADLLVLAARLLDEHDRVRRRVAGRLSWVLVDELHDVNPIQAQLMEGFASEGAHLVAVADPDQSIYAWRGADPEVVDRFAAAPGTSVFPLSRNYRSTPQIVELAQATLPNGNPYGKRLQSVRPPAEGPPVVAHLASVEDEAAFCVQRIADLINDGYEPGDIAVLYRAHHHSMELQLALADAGVEFELFSGARFVESAHVKDALAFCRLRHNPADDLAWLRALHLFPGVGPRTAERASRAAREHAEPLRAVQPGAGRAARGLRLAADTLAGIAGLDRPEEIVLLVARSAWYRDHLQRTYPNWRDREGDLARLAELAARHEGVEAFLSHLQLAERVEADEDISGPARRVALSSVHQAKGLEWPVVFVLQVEAGSFPSGWAVSEGRLDEEERLFYVAVTRAADQLYLCRPIAARRPWDTGPDAVVLNSGQGFLDRDLDGLVEEWSVR